jgi:mRNA interferase RelE/StbE
MSHNYVITFSRSARKELQRLEVVMARRVIAKVEALAAEPRPRGCRKIRGAHELWRLRVGEYRVVYAVDDSDRVVDVIAVRPRRDVYR